MYACSIVKMSAKYAIICHMRAVAPSARSPLASTLTQDQAIGLLSGDTTWLTKNVPGLGQAFVADGPHGVRAIPGSTTLDIVGSLPATCFPTAVTLASTWDPDLVEQVGEALGKEAKALGVDVILGPGMNLKRHPLCGRNFEYFSEDPYLTGTMASALTEGIQSQNVGTSVKHFAVNNQESYRFVTDAIVDLRTLHELYLKGFEMVVRGARPWTVMGAYNMVNGVHACENEYLLKNVLRDTWGFDGLVMSDWGAVSDRVVGVKAGLDLEMPASKGAWDGELAQALRNGTLTREQVNECAQRVIDLVAKSNRLNPRKREIPGKMVAAHNALARKAAAAGTVLLKNDGVLPLANEIKVAVIGAFAKEPRFQGYGSSFVNATKVTSAIDAFNERGIEPPYARGYDPLKSPDDAAALTEAVVAAAKADVAIVFAGLPPVIESESFDRENLNLPPQHDALITAVAAANPNTVVVLVNGAPVLMPWLSQVRAVLEVYLGGQAGGGAIVDVLYGDAEPGGRLAETFPKRLDDVASNANFPGDPHQVVYAEQLNVGYRYNVTEQVAPLFPFGYGLSYTTFRWSNATVDREEFVITSLPDGAATQAPACNVEVTVTNAGNRAGTEVVQVYLRDQTGLVERPRRELAAFAKVALVPGESKRVTIPVPKSAFAVWDVTASSAATAITGGGAGQISPVDSGVEGATDVVSGTGTDGATGIGGAAGGAAGSWKVPSGDYELEVARNSAEIVAALPVTVTGSITEKLRPVAAPVGGNARPVRPFTRESTIGELEQTFVGRRIGAIVRKASTPDDADELTAKMFERQNNELPLRSAAMFSGGKLTLKMADAVLAAANSNLKGLPALLKARLRK